jgi:hypothetical protein
VRRGGEIGTRIGVGAILVVAACACGSDEPPDVVATMTEACSESEAILAAAPEPVDDASEAAFLAASDEAARASGFPARDLGEDVDDPALDGLAFQLDRFPRLIGAREPVQVAFEARAAIARLDRFAGELGVEQCGAGAWRLDDWVALADRLADRPTEGSYREDVEVLCADTFGSVSFGGTDALADVIAATSARRAISDFTREFGRMVPPDSLDDEHVDLLAALIDLDFAIPDFAPTNPSPDSQQRLDLARTNMVAALEALDVDC